MAKKRKLKKGANIHLLAKWHAVLTMVTLVFYVLLAIFGDLSFLARDLRSKYVWAATTLSVYVEALPNQPIVEATSACLGDQAVVNLDWNNTAATDYFDILRDGNMLVGGITATEYTDITVTIGMTYEYVIIAHGSMGSVSSSAESIIVQACNSNPPVADPQCQIISLDGAPINFSSAIRTRNSQPVFSGTTNIENANMVANIFPGPILSGMLSANGNGFWEYRIPFSLDAGTYIFQITSIDPEDESRRITKTIQFEVIRSDDDDDDDDDDDRHHHDGGDDNSGEDATFLGEAENDNDDSDKNNQDAEILTYSEKLFPLMLRAEVVNRDKVVYAGQNVFADVFFEWINVAPQATNLVYEIVDKNGQVVFSIARKNKASAEHAEQMISLPSDLEFGEYLMRIRTRVEKMNITSEDSFEYREAPMVKLGGTMTLTYSEMVGGMGWLAILFLLLLIIFVALSMHEHYLCSRSLRMVTERGLERDGMISKRKEVSS